MRQKLEFTVKLSLWHVVAVKDFLAKKNDLDSFIDFLIYNNLIENRLKENHGDIVDYIVSNEKMIVFFETQKTEAFV